jgi:tetratricopeptide (TPR) repeat protein
MNNYIWHRVTSVVARRKRRVLFFAAMAIGCAFVSVMANPSAFVVYPQPHLATMQSILNYSSAASAQLANLKHNYPNHPATVYLENYKAFADFLAFEKPVDAQTFPILAERRIALTTSLVSQPIAAVYQCNMLLQVALVHAMQGNNVTAFRTVLKAQQLQKQIPDNESFLQERNKLALVFDLFWAIVPDDYQWVLELWGRPVHLHKTIPLLNRYVAQQKGVVGLSDEAHLLSSLFLLKANVPGKDVMAHQPALTVTPLSLYVDGLLALKTKQLPGVMPLLLKADCDVFPPLHYLKGRMLLNDLQVDAGRRSLQLFLQLYQGPTFKNDAMLRVAWCSLLDGDMAGAQRIGKELLLANHAKTYADRQALSEVKYLAGTNAIMLKIRLLFDAGNAKQSLALALSNRSLASSVACEYHYRIGRARHELGMFDLALLDYKTAIDNNTAPDRYFAANAALKSATIYYGLGQHANAKAMLKQCLSLNRGDYSSSIKNEARQLQRQLNALGD